MRPLTPTEKAARQAYLDVATDLEATIKFWKQGEQDISALAVIRTLQAHARFARSKAKYCRGL